jgi:hypothetical protein
MGAHPPPVPTSLSWYYPNLLVTGHDAARILDELVKDMTSRPVWGRPIDRTSIFDMKGYIKTPTLI